nr:hypothetical protein [Tanacetum cinerariifolium]
DMGAGGVVVEIVRCIRDGERGGKTRDKRMQGLAGNIVHSTVFQTVKDREGVLFGDFTHLVPGVGRD